MERNDNAGCAEAAAAGRRGELHSRNQPSGTCICVYTWRHVYPYKLYTLLFTLTVSRCGILSTHKLRKFKSIVLKKLIKVLSKDIKGKIYKKNVVGTVYGIHMYIHRSFFLFKKEMRITNAH